LRHHGCKTPNWEATVTTLTLRTLTTLLLAAATIVAVSAQKVSHDFDKQADFGAIKTFAFKQGTPSGNSLVDNRITSAIAGALAGRGMTRVDADADVYVVTHLTFDKEKDFTAYSTGYGPYGWYWGAGWETTEVRVREILMGTLVIDLVDAKKGAVIWRGMGVKEVKPHAKASKIDKNVNTTVAKILKNYPPNRASS